MGLEIGWEIICIGAVVASAAIVGRRAESWRRRFFAPVVVFFGGAMLSSCAVLENFSPDSPREQARQRVADALAVAAEKGDAEAIRLINGGMFRRGEEYVFVFEAGSGVILANPAFPEIVGKTLKAVSDSSGHSLTDLVHNATAAGNWVEYDWINPADGKVSRKTSWVQLSGDYVYGSGVYEKE